MIQKKYLLILLLFILSKAFSQNSMVGDGFGGRLWYKPYNYTVGSYSGYTVCGDSFQLFSWGTNQYGQLGNGTATQSKTPVAALGMTHVKFYSCGYIMSVIKCDSTGWVWGKATPNQLIPISPINGVSFTDAGSHDVSFVKYDGTVWSVGVNSHGEFGNGVFNSANSFIPQKMNSINNAVRVANGFNTITVLTKDRKVYTSGPNTYGALGVTGVLSAFTPIKVDTLKGIVDIKAVDYTVIALDSLGDVYQWGKHLTSTISDTIPKKLSQLKNIVAISGCDDGDHFLALDSARNCYGWGINKTTFGAPITTAGIDTPMLLATNVVDILAGESFSYLVKADGSFWCAGLNIPVWMNLKDSIRGVFTKLNPTDSPMYLCGALPFHEPVRIFDSVHVCNNDSVLIKNVYYKPDTILRDTVYFGGECSVDTINITVITNKFLFYKKITLCKGDSIKVGIHTYFQTGLYTDSLFSIKSCDSVINTNLTVNEKSFFSLNYTICKGDSLTFWNRVYKTPGVFQHVLKNTTGCDSLITLNLTVNNSSSSSQNATICMGDSIIFNSKTYTVQGIYKDTLLNFSGCDSIITFNLGVINRNTMNQNFRICDYETVKVGTHNYYKAGKYIDSLKNIAGCDSILITTLEVKSSPVLHLRDTTLCEFKKDIIYLDAGTYKFYAWLPGGEISREISVSKAGVYIVTITSFDSCSATDSLLVKDSCAPVILIPNVFTVNNDKLNDAFDIEIKGETEYHLKIFNRWGQLVFESNEDGIDKDGINWDGTYFNKGVECPAGVYYFLFNYQFPKEEPGEYKGAVTLIRK